MNVGKKLFILLFSLGLAFGASAQRGHVVIAPHGGYYHGGYAYYPRTYVGVGFGLGYPWWGWGYGWYGPWYGPYPAYYYGYGAMPNQLELQVQDIRNDYAAQIKDVKHDKALSRQERRNKVNQLKQDRDAAIVQARHDYFDNSKRNYQNQHPKSGNSSNGSSSNGSGGSASDGPEYQDQGSSNTGSK
jgi:hypothetical protein